MQRLAALGTLTVWLVGCGGAAPPPESPSGADDGSRGLTLSSNASAAAPAALEDAPPAPGLYRVRSEHRFQIDMPCEAKVHDPKTTEQGSIAIFTNCADPDNLKIAVIAGYHEQPGGASREQLLALAMPSRELADLVSTPGTEPSSRPIDIGTAQGTELSWRDRGHMHLARFLANDRGGLFVVILGAHNDVDTSRAVLESIRMLP